MSTSDNTLSLKVTAGLYEILIKMVYTLINLIQGYPEGTMIKNLCANVGDTRDAGSVSGSGRTPGVGNDNLLQYSYAYVDSCNYHRQDRHPKKLYSTLLHQTLYSFLIPTNH